MSHEHAPQKEEGEMSFHEQFPHLKHHTLTKEQEEHFLVLHKHNETREAEDRITHDELLKKVFASSPKKEEVYREESHKDGVIKKKERKEIAVRTVVTNVVDFIPVIGSIKMIAEGARGKQYGTGEEIAGFKRIIHSAAGVGFLALDLTGIGSIMSELGKGAFKVGERIVVKDLEKVAEHVAIEEAGKIAAHGFIKKEVESLVVRGELRHEREKKVLRPRGAKRVEARG